MARVQLDDLIPSGAYVPTSKRVPLRQWIDNVGITLRGTAYTTHKHEYLEKILADTTPYQVFRKGRTGSNINNCFT